MLGEGWESKVATNHVRRQRADRHGDHNFSIRGGNYQLRATTPALLLESRKRLAGNSGRPYIDRLSDNI